MSVSAATMEKAERLLRERAVAVLLIEDRGAVAAVAGDHGCYLTTVIDPRFAPIAASAPRPYPLCSCTCDAGRAGGICSHATALGLLLERRGG